MFLFKIKVLYYESHRNVAFILLVLVTSAAYVGVAGFVTRATGAAGRGLPHPLAVFAAEHAGRSRLFAGRSHSVLHTHPLSLMGRKEMVLLF